MDRSRGGWRNIYRIAVAHDRRAAMGISDPGPGLADAYDVHAFPGLFDGQ